MGSPVEVPSPLPDHLVPVLPDHPAFTPPPGPNYAHRFIVGYLSLLVLVLVGGVVSSWLFAVHPKVSASNPYGGWQTYQSSGLGVSFKYPKDWKVSISRDSQYAWQIIDSMHPNVTIGVRALVSHAAETSETLWTTCTQPKVCGTDPSEVNVSHSVKPIGNLDAYQVLMQNEHGFYHAAVIKKPVEGTAPMAEFMEFVTVSNDPTEVAQFNKITASTSFIE